MQKNVHNLIVRKTETDIWHKNLAQEFSSLSITGCVLRKDRENEREKEKERDRDYV